MFDHNKYWAVKRADREGIQLPDSQVGAVAEQGDKEPDYRGQEGRRSVQEVSYNPQVPVVHLRQQLLLHLLPTAPDLLHSVERNHHQVRLTPQLQLPGLPPQ